MPAPATSRPGSSAARSATACSAARPPTSTSSLAGDPEAAARGIARAGDGTAFELSGAFGAWRVVGRGHRWHVDIVRLRDDDLESDLAARDFTVNAMAEPLAGGELVDPHGGRADLEARRLRMVSAAALAEDPLRTLRAARLAAELELEVDGRHRRRRPRARARARRASRPSACSRS